MFDQMKNRPTSGGIPFIQRPDDFKVDTVAREPEPKPKKVYERLGAVFAPSKEQLERRGITQAAVSDAVKDDVAQLYGFSRELCDTQEGKTSYIITPDGPQTIRQLLINYSLSMKEAYGENVWAMQVVRRIQHEREYRPEITDIVIHDWRFQIEIETLAKEFQDRATLHTIRIRRSSIQSLPIPSEHNIDTYPFSIYIENEGTIELLEQQIYKLINDNS
jgi:hypothetical protein